MGILKLLAVVAIAVAFVFVLTRIDLGAPTLLCGECETGLRVGDAVVVGLLATTLIGALIAVFGAFVIAAQYGRPTPQNEPYVRLEQRRRARRDAAMLGVAILVIGAALVGLAPLAGSASAGLEANEEASASPSAATSPSAEQSPDAASGPGFVICPSACTIVPLPEP